MADRIVVLKAEDPISFVADACAALAEAVNEIRLSTVGEHDLEAAYAEMVVAYSHLVLPTVRTDRQGVARAAVIAHLVTRLRQAQDGEVSLSVLEIVDRLHGELEAQRAPV